MQDFPRGAALAGQVALALAWVVAYLLWSRAYFRRLDPVGIAFALFAGVCWAAYILLSGRVGAATPGLAGLAAAATVAGVLLLPVGVASAGTALLEPGLLALGAAVGLLSAAVPYGLELVALRTLPAAVFAVLMSLEPAVGALAGFVVLRERLAPAEIAGVLLVCVASVAVARTAPAARPEPVSRRRPPRASRPAR